MMLMITAITMIMMPMSDDARGGRKKEERRMLRFEIASSPPRCRRGAHRLPVRRSFKWQHTSPPWSTRNFPQQTER